MSKAYTCISRVVASQLPQLLDGKKTTRSILLLCQADEIFCPGQQ